MRRMSVNLSSRSYDILIEYGLLDSIGQRIREKFCNTCSNKKTAIITDTNVGKLYAERLVNSLKKEGFTTSVITIEPGESSKSFEVLQRVCNELLKFGLNRNDFIVALGGGVVGDLGGFAASILLRGVPYIQVPTSLLSQIDSSIGGKVAINTDYGKNLLGSFYQPAAVFIDPELLGTLNEKYLYDGMAEVIKYGAIKDRHLFSELLSFKSVEELMDNMENIIYTCCSIKKELVEKDETDRGERMILNFGHTIGHAIEKYFGYGTYTHGEAVAAGMYIITKNSEALGMTQKGTSSSIKEMLDKYHLPHDVSYESHKIKETVLLDKKNMNGTINLVLLESIGCGYIKKVDTSELNNFIYL